MTLHNESETTSSHKFYPESLPPDEVQKCSDHSWEPCMSRNCFFLVEELEDLVQFLVQLL